MVRRELREVIKEKLPCWELPEVMVLALAILGCASGSGPEAGRDPGLRTVTQEDLEREGRDSQVPLLPSRAATKVVKEL